MKKFSQIVEKTDINNKLSSKHQALKRKIMSFIDELNWQNENDLKKILQENIRAFNNEIPITIPHFQQSDDLFSFWYDNYDLIDIILNDEEWFNIAPKSKGIVSVKNYTIESTKFALMKICELILSEI